MKKSILFVAIFYFICAHHLVAQQSSIVWQKGLGTANGDFATNIIKTDTGYVMVSSSLDPAVTSCHAVNDRDVYSVGLDSLLRNHWQICYGGSGADIIGIIIMNSIDGYYLYGSTSSTDGDINTPIHGNADMWLMRLDKDFNIIWSRTLSCPTWETEIDLLATNDGGVIALAEIWDQGYDVSIAYGDGDIWLCKVDSAGSIEWDKTIGNSLIDDATSITKKDDDSFYIVGASEYEGGMVECHRGTDLGFERDVIVYEVSNEGNIRWQHCYGGNGDDFGVSLIRQDDGFILLANTLSNDLDVSGNHLNGSNPSADFWLLKCDLNGEIVWQRCLGGSQYEEAFYMDVTTDGNIVVFGLTNSNDGDVHDFHGIPGWFHNDIWVAIVDSAGNVVWTTCYGSPKGEYFSRTVKNSDYDYLVLANAYTNDGDINCLPYPGNENFPDIWIFNINLCTVLRPEPPTRPSGIDTLICTNTTPQSTYSTIPANRSEGYNWLLQPETAGTIASTDTVAIVTWNPVYEGQAILKVRSQNNCGTSEWSDSLNIVLRTCNAIGENHNNIVKVWPNPANGQVCFDIIQPLSNPVQLTITDVTGRLILKKAIKEKQWIWNTGSIGNGIYLYTITTNGSVRSGKIEIVH